MNEYRVIVLRGGKYIPQVKTNPWASYSSGWMTIGSVCKDWRKLLSTWMFPFDDTLRNSYLECIQIIHYYNQTKAKEKNEIIKFRVKVIDRTDLFPEQATHICVGLT